MALKPSRETERFLANWPATARKIAAIVLVCEMLAGFAGRPVSALVLAAAGPLLIAPNVSRSQSRRNEDRYEDGDEGGE